MGYKIKVDHSQFEKTAKVIDEYTTKMSIKMSQADHSMIIMFSTWRGIDSTSYKNKWNTIKGDDSTYGKMKKSLESYSKFLYSAGNKYKKAQADAINRANKLPKWWFIEIEV